MPNPFDLRGPEFLVFYIVLGLFVLVVVWILSRLAEPAVVRGSPLTDYLRIAYLRGGADEALRVATMALIDRGLITVVDEDRMKAADSVPAGLQRTEQRLLESCRDTKKASEILSDPSLKVTVATECEATLVRAGLLPDSDIKGARLRIVFWAALFLGLVALVKVLIALNRGRSNVGFLIVMSIAFGIALYFVANPFRTRAGDTMLADLRTLFYALRDRAVSITSPTGGNDLALLAAVFGLTALPIGHVRVSRKLFAKEDTSSGSGCGSGGSSCGSSCGGGCGGGCGGCGS